tara:strand:+ start:114 stop:854 length:741 start_codon:yes stop_codon:yes gene_type:complete
MGIVDTYEKRHHVYDYEKKNIPDELVNEMLYKAWKITPSKNNFMPYQVSIIGPDQQDIKDQIWKRCAQNHQQVEESRFKVKNTKEGEQYTTQAGNRTTYNFAINRAYNHIRYNSHLLMFSSRVCKLQGYMKRMVEQEGHYAEQCEIKEVDGLRATTAFECGMFAAHLAGICIENGIDVSYNHCYTQDRNNWKELPFLWYDQKNGYARVHVNMSMGYGKYYRHQWLKDYKRGTDMKPEMEEVVKWIR